MARFVGKVASLSSDKAPFGVFVSVEKREGSWSPQDQQIIGKEALVRTGSSRVVSSLKVGETVRLVQPTMDNQGRVEARLAPYKSWREVRTTQEASSNRTEGQKPLLILDLNGVLCDRGGFAGGRKSPDASPLRPNALEFLSWCFERFDIGVWSCGKRENMEMSLFDGRTIVFAWDQRESTSLWPRTSIVSKEKPLFLKEISKVWTRSFEKDDASTSLSWRTPAAKPRRFGPEDTLLLDNHAEKFERNVPGSSAVVPTWTKDMEDDVLSLEGPLVAALADLAKAPNIAKVGEAKLVDEPTSTLAFVKVEPPPPVEEEEEDDDGDEPTEKADENAVTTTPPRPRKPEDYGRVRRCLVEAYCASATHRSVCPEYTVERYLQSKDSPGPRARPLRRRDLPDLGGQQWVVAEKTDGVRGWYFANKSGGAWLIKRDLNVLATLEDGTPTNDANAVTILDGEMIVEEKLFIVFDAVRCNGEDVGAMGVGGAVARLSRASTILSLEKRIGGWRILPKKYFEPPSRNAAAAAEFKTQCLAVVRDGTFVDANRTTQSDGLILARRNDDHGYYAAQCLKYKPVITLDVKLVVTKQILSQLSHKPHNDDDEDLYNEDDDLDDDEVVLEAAVSHDGRDVVVTSVVVDDDKADVLLKKRQQAGVVAECEYRGGAWHLVKLRPDKKRPNSLRTAWAVLESIADNLNVEAVLDAVLLPEPKKKKKIEPKKILKKGAPTDAVASHYDAVQQQRNKKKGMDDGMHRLRRLNNFVKALVMDRAVQVSSKQVPQFKEEASLEAVVEALRAPVTGNERRERRKRSDLPKATVVELACGRGGDLNKWKAHVDVRYLVGIDISPTSLREAERRWKQNHAPADSYRFEVADFGAASFPSFLSEKILSEKKVNFLACHFALHYACGERGRIEAFLDAVAQSLDDSGVFLATIVRWDALRDLLKESDTATISDLCKVEAPAKTIDGLRGLPETEAAIDDAFNGLSYKFSLGDAVDDCDEFVVHVPSLRALAKERGLQVDMAESFEDVLKHAHGVDPTAFAKLAGDVGVRPNDAKDPPTKKAPLSDAQVSVSSLYGALLMRKSSSPLPPAGDDDQ